MFNLEISLKYETKIDAAEMGETHKLQMWRQLNLFNIVIYDLNVGIKCLSVTQWHQVWWKCWSAVGQEDSAEGLGQGWIDGR